MAHTKSGKRKLTLTVDAGTVEKAKRLGLNISEVTENVLRNFTFDPKEETRSALRERYQTLFQTMLPMIKEYETSVRVATVYDKPTPRAPGGDPHEVHLQDDGTFWIGDAEVLVTFDDLQDAHFWDPDEILKGFIDSLEKAKEKRRERIEDLELVRRIVEAISAKSTGKNEKDAEGGRGERSVRRHR